MAGTTNRGFDSWATDHVGLRVLSEEECLAALAGQRLGRLAFAADGEVEIFPVAFVLDRSAVVIRTGLGTKLMAALDRIAVAFEVDHSEPASRSGWSVVLKGTCEEVADPAILARLEATTFENWLEYPHRSSTSHWIRIRPYSITGRALPPRIV